MERQDEVRNGRKRELIIVGQIFIAYLNLQSSKKNCFY